MSEFLKCRWGILAAFAISLYIFGYAGARAHKLIVHRTTFRTVAGEKRYIHSMTAGDFGIGPHPLMASANLVFFPLVCFEALYWSLKEERPDSTLIQQTTED